jgi:hypothetical protein
MRGILGLATFAIGALCWFVTKVRPVPIIAAPAPSEQVRVPWCVRLFGCVLEATQVAQFAGAIGGAHSPLFYLRWRHACGFVVHPRLVSVKNPQRWSLIRCQPLIERSFVSNLRANGRKRLSWTPATRP